jgi:hypothetical protein
MEFEIARSETLSRISSAAYARVKASQFKLVARSKIKLQLQKNSQMKRGKNPLFFPIPYLCIANGCSIDRINQPIGCVSLCRDNHSKVGWGIGILKRQFDQLEHFLHSIRRFLQRSKVIGW